MTVSVVEVGVVAVADCVDTKPVEVEATPWPRVSAILPVTSEGAAPLSPHAGAVTAMRASARRQWRGPILMSAPRGGVSNGCAASVLTPGPFGSPFRRVVMARRIVRCVRDLFSRPTRRGWSFLGYGLGGQRVSCAEGLATMQCGHCSRPVAITFPHSLHGSNVAGGAGGRGTGTTAGPRIAKL